MCFFHFQNGSLQLSPASHSLLKSQQIILNGTQQRIVVPKLNIRMDGQQTQGKCIAHSSIRSFAFWHFASKFVILGFGLPPTPPSSLSSDDSEDNQSAEMHTIPSSPASSLSSLSPSNNNSPQAQLAQNGAKNSHSNVNHGSPNSSRNFNAPSSRQPIHTPLISNQPVWSLSECKQFYEFNSRLIEQFENYRKGQPANLNWPKKRSEPWSLRATPFQPDYLLPNRKKNRSRKSGGKSKIRFVMQTHSSIKSKLLTVCSRLHFHLDFSSGKSTKEKGVHG